MTSKNNKGSEQNNSQSTDELIAKLSFIGAALATIGDGVATYAAGLALKEFEDQKNSNQLSAQISTISTSEIASQLDAMQKQLRRLSRKVDEMERKINKL